MYGVRRTCLKLLRLTSVTPILGPACVLRTPYVHTAYEILRISLSTRPDAPLRRDVYSKVLCSVASFA